MKLEPIAKPIKIRIKIGDKEYSDFDSVKNNFSAQELYPLFKDGRLERWLRQIGQETIANSVQETSQNCGNGSIKDYILFLSVFFDEISASLQGNELDDEDSLDNYLANISLDLLRVIFNYTKGTKEVDWKKLFEKFLSKSNFKDIFENETTHDVYSKNEWKDRFMSLVKKEDFELDEICQFYQHKSLCEIGGIDWGMAFAKSMCDWDKEHKEIKEILKDKPKHLTRFYKYCAYEKGIDDAKSKVDPWGCLARSKECENIMKALDEYTTKHKIFDKEIYNYSQMKSILGRQILDFLQSLTIYKQTNEWPDIKYDGEEYFFEDEKNIIIAVHKRYPKEGYKIFSRAAKAMFSVMIDNGNLFAKYIKEKADSVKGINDSEVTLYAVKQIAKKINKYRL